MKFLVTSRNKDSYYALAPEKRAQLLMEAYAFLEKYRKAGKLKEVFYTSDMKGMVSIWEIGSSEESARLVIETPTFAFQDIEAQPLIEFDVAKEVVTDYVKKMAKK